MRTRDANKENSIREKAIEMIVKEGLDGFSMQKLAKAAGVSPATLYIYYKDRDDLVIKIATEVSVRMMDISLRGLHPKMSFAEGMSIQWKNRLEFYISYPLDVQFIEQIRYTPVYDNIKKTIRTTFGDVLGKFMHNAINKGECTPLPFEVYWSIAFAPLYQLMKFHAQGETPASDNFKITDSTVELTLQLVLKALKP
ncbi:MULTISPECIES: TetR/AcrR family transcriptional regulator [Niastella]|uniref:TetR/AcrR family transcriptional regulator n=1 Tax=Niastella soli TaxID=2821487 RepID=A0ABS3YTN1_9BACT|nr:TetR/AcrR family transcriptional regulator [Niastella soli]MBO9201133.1 TetR/AcrR family transcriptional regulator [Niastella soli]